MSVWSTKHLPKLQISEENKCWGETQWGICKKRYRFKSRMMNYLVGPLRLNHYNIYKSFWFSFWLKWKDIAKNLEGAEKEFWVKELLGFV